MDPTVAGYVSVPRSGLGADFALTFSTGEPQTKADGATASSSSSRRRAIMEQESVVVGVLLDDESMAVLSRLDGLAVQRAYGKNGYPMVKTVVAESASAPVATAN